MSCLYVVGYMCAKKAFSYVVLKVHLNGSHWLAYINLIPASPDADMPLYPSSSGTRHPTVPAPATTVKTLNLSVPNLRELLPLAQRSGQHRTPSPVDLSALTASSTEEERKAMALRGQLTLLDIHKSLDWENEWVFMLTKLVSCINLVMQMVLLKVFQ